MKQKTHYSEALAYLRDYCLHYSEMGRPASELVLTDKTHFRGRWKTRNDL